MPDVHEQAHCTRIHKEAQQLSDNIRLFHMAPEPLVCVTTAVQQ